MSPEIENDQRLIGYGHLLGSLSAADHLMGAILAHAEDIARYGACDQSGITDRRVRALAARVAQLSAALDKAVAALPAELRKAA